MRNYRGSSNHGHPHAAIILHVIVTMLVRRSKLVWVLGRLNGLGHGEGEFGPLVIMARSAIRSCGMPAGNNMAQRPMVPFLQP